MGRRKSKVKIPFTKSKLSISFMQTLVGLTIVLATLICLYSLFAEGEMLIFIKSNLIGQFGYGSFIFLLVGLMFGIKFISPRKITFIKWHWMIGLMLLGVAVMGLIRSGSVGELIFDELTTDFTIFGSTLLLSMIMLVGLIIFFDTSLEALVGYFAMMSSGIGGLFGKNDDEASTVKIKGTFSEDQNLNSAKAVIRTTVNPKMVMDNELKMRPTNIGAEVAYVYPSIDILHDQKEEKVDKNELAQNAATIEKSLDSYGVKARVQEINPGPTVTQYALAVASGTPLNRVTGLANEIAYNLASINGTVRIEAPMPGRSLVGIEIPNRKSQVIGLKRMLASPEMSAHPSPLAMPLGIDVAGNAIISDLAQMPHVLIAGTTGSGKSVILNTWITTWLYRASQHDLRMILIDPKRVELSIFANIPHLLTPPIVEMDQAVSALSWAVKEMERRYSILQKSSVRNIKEYHALEKQPEVLPYIVIAIDELADLMVVAAKEAETLIQRISQKARAVGIHLVLATQRPSVNVITGVIKANIPSRIAFNVASVVDSKVILDQVGADKLLGKGDMLYMAPDRAKPHRIQAPFISTEEVSRVVDFIRTQHPIVHYTEEVVNENVQMNARGGLAVKGGDEERDPMFEQAVQTVLSTGKASASYLQRAMGLGYARAARILDQMEGAGIIGPANGSKPREIYQRFEE